MLGEGQNSRLEGVIGTGLIKRFFCQAYRRVMRNPKNFGYLWLKQEKEQESSKLVQAQRDKEVTKNRSR